MAGSARVRKVWKLETGSDLDTLPQDLGKFELGSDEYSIGLALQQIAPYLGRGTLDRITVQIQHVGVGLGRLQILAPNGKPQV